MEPGYWSAAGPADRLDRRGHRQPCVALSVADRAGREPATEAARGAPLHARHDPERRAASAAPWRRAGLERRRLRRPTEQDREIQGVHPRPARPPPRLQAVLWGGHQPDEATAGPAAEATARADRLRVAWLECRTGPGSHSRP